MKSLLRIFKDLGEFKLHVILALFFRFVGTIAFIVVPVGSALIINQAIVNENISLLVEYSIYLLLISFVGIISHLIGNYNNTKIGAYYSAKLRAQVFESILGFSKGNVNKHSSGELLTIATNDVTQVEFFTSMLFGFVVVAPITFVGAIVMSLMLSPELSMLYLILLPVLIISVVFISVYVIPRYRKVQKATDNINTTSKESITNVRLVKSTVSGEVERKKFGDAVEDYRINSYKANRTIALAFPIVMVVMNIGLALLMIFSGMLVEEGKLLTLDGVADAGTISAFVQYTLQVCFSVIMVTMVIVFMSRAVVSANRIYSIIDEKPKVETKEAKGKELKISGDIEFDNVSFTYNPKAKNKILNNISFKIKSGESIGIVGSTGSGKSTLLHLLTRNYDVTSGSVKYDGVDIKDINVNTLRNQIGIAVQTPFVFMGTIGGNIKQGKSKASNDEIMVAAKSASADSFIGKKPKGLDERTEKAGANLSGGQKQRVALSRALVKNPTILILDDTTSALDANTEHEVLKSIGNLEHCKTKIIVASKVSTLMKQDRILVLDNYGNLDGFDTHKNLVKSSKVYQEICKSQEGGQIDE